MKNFNIELKWAAIFSVISLIWMYVEKNLGWHSDAIFKHQFFTNLIIIPLLFIIILTLALREKRKVRYNYSMTWEQGLICGGVISVIISILTPLLQYNFAEVISPDYFDLAAKQLSERGGTSLKSAQDIYNLKANIIDAIEFNLAMGIVTSAIISAILKKPATKD